MELAVDNGFMKLSSNEINEINGGGMTAFVYALGFVAGTTPLNVCIGAGLVVVGAGCCIYGALNH